MFSVKSIGDGFGDWILRRRSDERRDVDELGECVVAGIVARGRLGDRSGALARRASASIGRTSQDSLDREHLASYGLTNGAIADRSWESFRPRSHAVRHDRMTEPFAFFDRQPLTDETQQTSARQESQVLQPSPVRASTRILHFAPSARTRLGDRA